MEGLEVLLLNPSRFAYIVRSYAPSRKPTFAKVVYVYVPNIYLSAVSYVKTLK